MVIERHPDGIPSNAGGQVVKKTRMVKKFRPKPRAARQAPPPRQMQFNQQAELQIPQHMGAMATNMTAMAPQAASELSGAGPYKGTDGGDLDS